MCHMEAEAIVGGKKPIKDPGAAATACFTAAGIYAGLLIFCTWQSRLNRENSRSGS